jgi:hypothetical protein
MKLSSNQDLYDYLRRLICELQKAGATTLVHAVSFAADQASSMSAEFLGESRLALRQVLDQENGALSQSQRADLESVINQLDDALDRR